jgi:hypothetical protein
VILLVSQRVGRDLEIDQIAELVRDGKLSITDGQDQVVQQLVFALVAIRGWSDSVVKASGRVVKTQPNIST